VRKFKETEKSETELPIVRKFPDAENSTSVDINLLQKPDKNDLVLKHWLVRNEAVEMALAEVPEPRMQSQTESSATVEDVPSQRWFVRNEAVEMTLAEVPEPSIQAQTKGNMTTENIPFQTGDQIFQSADGVGRVIDGFDPRAATSSLEDGAMDAFDRQSLETAIPLPKGIWVLVDEPILGQPTQEEPMDAKLSDNTFPSLAEAPPEESDFLLDTALFSAQLAEPSSKENTVVLGGRLLQWSRADDPTTSARMTPTIVPTNSVLQQISPEQLPQTEATHNALRLEPLFDQIVQSVRFAQHAQSSELQLHLKPDFLGRLSIRVMSDYHGMRIEIKAEYEVVRQLMQDHLADLQQRLAEKGFAFNQLSLLADPSWTSRREPGWSFASPSNGFPAASEATAETLSEQPETLIRRGVIDYFA
jgi:hypothetical protein